MKPGTFLKIHSSQGARPSSSSLVLESVLGKPGRMFRKATADSEAALINTPLQRGERHQAGVSNRINGFSHFAKTVKTVLHLSWTTLTPLKRGVNERLLSQAQRQYEVFGLRRPRSGTRIFNQALRFASRSLVVLSLVRLPAAEAMTPSELKARLEAHESITVIDVRSTDRFATGHIPGAINVPAALATEKRLPPLGRVVVWG